ncbi:MAG: MFS transporter [Rhizobiales bacterium]|nr:MFS transporter [Hyphomicrobiales bacterium]MBI3674845.1 MFS transporter [Hyphomicrobiales bacterium]
MAHAAAPLSHSDIRTIVIGVGLAMFLAALDQTAIATALPTIAADLGDFQSISWVASIYLLTATAVTPLYGKFSDIHGRRVTLLIGIAVFVAGSVACALAPTMLALIAARAVQGLGGGGLISLAQTIVADIVAPKERGRYQIYFASVFLSASLVGPMLGGFATEHLHWSVIFWINVPLGAVAYAMTRSVLRRLPRHDRPHRLDVLGALLLVAATVALMLALHDGGSSYRWLSAPILGLSILMWLAFAWRIAYAAEPLIPLDILADRVVLMGTISASFGMGTYIGLSIYMPVYFQAVRGLSPAYSGLALIPLMVGTVIGATIAGQTMGRITHYKRLPVLGMMLAMAGAAVLAAADGRLTLAQFEIVLSLISVGLGTLLPTTMVAIQNAVKPHQLGTATGTMNFLRQLGASLLVAVFGAILLGVGGSTSAELASGPQAALAFFWIFVATFIGFVLAFIFVVLMKEQPLRSAARRAAEAVTVD